MFLIGDFSAAAELLVSGLQELWNIEQFVFTMNSDGTYSNPQDMDSKAASLELTKSCLQNFSMIQWDVSTLDDLHVMRDGLEWLESMLNIFNMIPSWYELNEI